MKSYYATFTLCSRQSRQSHSKPPWTKRDWRNTTQWDEMGKRDIPWLKSQSFNPFGLCYALFLTGKAVTFHWPPWTERDGRGATPEDGMWKPAWPWSPSLPAQIFKLTKNWSRHVAMQMRNLYKTVLKRSNRNTAWQCVPGRNLTSSKVDGRSSFTKKLKLKIRDPLERDREPPEFREFGGPFHDGPLYYGINSDTDTVISRTFPKTT